MVSTMENIMVSTMVSIMALMVEKTNSFLNYFEAVSFF